MVTTRRRHSGRRQDGIDAAARWSYGVRVVTFVVVIELAGGTLLLAGLTALAFGVFAMRDHRVVARTPPTPLGSWDPPARRRAGLATTAYGPGGRYVAPVSGADCAWYAAELIRVPSRRMVDETVDADTLWRQAAAAPAAIVDETGVALVDPHLTESPPSRNDTPLAEITVRFFRPQTLHAMPASIPRHAYADVRPYESLRLTELRVPAGRPTYVLGAAVRDGRHVMLVPARHGPTIVTRDLPSQVRRRQRRSAHESRRIAKGLTLAGATLSMLATALLWLLIPAA
jgi:hypothetical protein